MALIDDLVTALTVLPGVGPKSAQRMALHLLQRDRSGGVRLSTALERAMRDVRQRRICRNLTEAEVCRLCDDPQREKRLLCVLSSLQQMCWLSNKLAVIEAITLFCTANCRRSMALVQRNWDLEPSARTD